MAQMPKGVPVGCLAIDGAFNAGILAASIIGNFDTKVKSNLERWRRLQTQSIKKKPCLLYTSPSPRDMRRSRMPSSA